jgi:hypothetical protein
MAQFAREQFASLLGLFAAGYVQEDAKHDAIDDAFVSTPAASRGPAHLVANIMRKSIIWGRDRASSSECSPDSVPIRRVDIR